MKEEVEHHSKLLEENFRPCLSRPPAEVAQPTSTHSVAQPADDSAGRSRAQVGGSSSSSGPSVPLPSPATPPVTLERRSSSRPRKRKVDGKLEPEGALQEPSSSSRSRKRAAEGQLEPEEPSQVPRQDAPMDQLVRQCMSKRSGGDRSGDEYQTVQESKHEGSGSSEALWKQWKTRRSRSRRRRANSK